MFGDPQLQQKLYFNVFCLLNNNHDDERLNSENCFRDNLPLYKSIKLLSTNFKKNQPIQLKWLQPNWSLLQGRWFKRFGLEVSCVNHKIWRLLIFNCVLLLRKNLSNTGKQQGRITKSNCWNSLHLVFQIKIRVNLIAI